MENQTQNKMLEPVQPLDRNTILAEGRCEPKTFDVPLKKYRKKYVNEYLEALNRHYTEIIEANTNEIIKLGEAYSELADMYNSLLAQHNQLSSSYIVLQEEKSKVADALIQAENKANDIITSARRQAEFERRELEEKSENLRVNIVDKNKQLRNMRLEVTQMCNGVKSQMEAALKAITDKMDEEIKSFNTTVSSVEIKYESVGDAKGSQNNTEETCNE
ncbi:MAG: hypothetical protein IKL09_03865 [Clostridia bacterium]|nr:hypothetical protein [Clostridia bacterium]